jgi:hypothetical protein
VVIRSPIRQRNHSFSLHKFGVPWQASAGFTFQQLLFQPMCFVALQARSVALKFADLNIKSMEDSVKSNVFRAYYAVLIAEKRKSIY